MQNICVNSEKSHYSGIVNGTIHVVAGGGGSHLSAFTNLETKWSIFKDYDFGFVKLTAFNHISLLFCTRKAVMERFRIPSPSPGNTWMF